MKEDLSEIKEIFKGIIQAGERVFQNYLQNFSGYQHDLRDISMSYAYFASKVLVDPKEMSAFQNNCFRYFDQHQKLLNETMGRWLGKPFTPVIHPAPDDKRFNSPEWNNHPYFAHIKENYLLFSELVRNVMGSSVISDKEKRKLHFYTNHYLNALSPANFLISNPEVIRLANETGGESLVKGFKNLVADIKKGSITQTDEAAFEVGKNLAVTKGAVIYQNELIQLIQYSPMGAKVYEYPLLIIPPWINKYYILDLRPENSFARYMVEKGFTVFMISWKNPSPEMRNCSFDDYVEKGVLTATEIIQAVTGAKKINALGYCLGGTLLGVALSVMYARNKVPVQSATFLAAMHDFTDVGPMGDVIDQALVNKLERGELQEEGIMHGHDMERAFNLIRANDLVWYYVVNNYLKGKKPAPFDVLFWTNDNTNLPAKMFAYYMRNMILENKLSRKNALRICDVPIDIGKIKIPSFVIAMREDHISPPATAFTTTELLSGPVEFMLGDSGHVMGVANPPSKKKYGYSASGTLGYGFETWEKTARHFSGSWWEHWSNRLKTLSGKKTEAPRQPGSKKYKAIEEAPGSYVQETVNGAPKNSLKLIPD